MIHRFIPVLAVVVLCSASVYLLMPEFPNGIPVELDLNKVSVFECTHELGRFPRDFVDAEPHLRKRLVDALLAVEQRGPDEYTVSIKRRGLKRFDITYRVSENGELEAFNVRRAKK